MAESPMVGARIPQDWQQQIQAIATDSGRKEAEIVREASAQYLGRTKPVSVKAVITTLDDRVTLIKRKLACFGESGELK